MVSDVPLGAFLSGGIDSSSIAALMTKHASSSVKTFSVIFGEQEYCESEYSDEMAQYLGTDHSRILLQERDLVKEVPSIFNAMDQPSMDGFNTYYYI